MAGPLLPNHSKEEGMTNLSHAARAGILLVALAVGACSATRTQQAPGEVIDDSLLTAKVKAALIEDPVTKANDINVETYRGVVQLGGFVDSADQKSQAATVAKSVTGVREVRNDLRVSSPQATTGQVIDDTVITSTVKARLIEDPTTKAHQVNVESQKGVVQLTGFVDDAAARSRATQLAQSVDGVRDVRNDLEIRQSP